MSDHRAPLALAIDIGGTFTDLAAVDRRDGSLILSKVATTPSRLQRGVLSALDGSGVLPADVGAFVHGSTVVINAVTERRGHLVSGKFDQFSSHTPYASLIDALSELVRQLLGEPPERLARWRDAIVGTLGGNLGVVADVIPDVTRITGPPPPVPDLGPTEAQHRFNLVFRQFIGTFTSPDHPLVLFLDDLHWGDAASIRLLRTLVSDPDAHNLLVIGAFRPETVDAEGHLTQTLTSLDPTRVHRIDLGPLPHDVVVDLVADTLRTSREEAASLGALVDERTAGNPFFVGQFLLSLTEDGLIRFAADTGRWLWDLPAIRQRCIVVEINRAALLCVALQPTIHPNDLSLRSSFCEIPEAIANRSEGG